MFHVLTITAYFSAGNWRVSIPLTAAMMARVVEFLVQSGGKAKSLKSKWIFFCSNCEDSNFQRPNNVSRFRSGQIENRIHLREIFLKIIENEKFP